MSETAGAIGFVGASIAFVLLAVGIFVATSLLRIAAALEKDRKP